MATKSIAFRLNDKNREDKEIMDWLDKAVYEGEYYDSLTEAVKWAILCFIRGEIRTREEMTTIELMQEFVRDFAKQSRVLFVNLFDADLFNLFGSINLHFSQISQ